MACFASFYHPPGIREITPFESIVTFDSFLNNYMFGLMHLCTLLFFFVCSIPPTGPGAPIFSFFWDTSLPPNSLGWSVSHQETIRYLELMGRERNPNFNVSWIHFGLSGGSYFRAEARASVPESGVGCLAKSFRFGSNEMMIKISQVLSSLVLFLIGQLWPQ